MDEASINYVDHNRAWLREQRTRLGWSASDVAEQAQVAAQKLGDSIQLSQQLVSAFENGRHKSTPRWLGYVQVAMLSHIRANGLPLGDVFRLRLPPALQAFLHDRESGLIRRPKGQDIHHGGGFAQDDDDVVIDSIDLSFGMGGGAFVDGDVEVAKVKFSRAWLRQFTSSPTHMLVSTRGIGDSMTPTIQDQDVLIVDRSQNRLVDQMNDKVWAIMFGDLGMVKRLRKMPDGTVKIMSDNPLISPEVAGDGELYIVGRVVARVSTL